MSDHLTDNVHETHMCRYTPVIPRKVVLPLAGSLCGSLYMLRVLAPRRAFVGGRKQLTLWLAGGAYRTISLIAQIPQGTFVPPAFVLPYQRPRPSNLTRPASVVDNCQD